MNVIGEIGNFIMIYQEPLQLAAFAALVVGGMVCVGKIIANAARKRRLLEQINETVLEISDNVKVLKDKRTEVIYIDGRMTPEDRTPVPPSEVKPEDVSQTVQEEEIHEEKNEVPEEEVKPAAKYFSRDCAVAKDGRKYTMEELDAQIRD